MAYSIDLKKLLPRSLQVTFWQDFMDVISDELTNLKTQVDAKRYYFQPEELADLSETDWLNALSEYLGYTPNLVVDTSDDFLKTEIESIDLRIRKRTAYVMYDYLFGTIGKKGEIFSLFYDGTKLVRPFNESLEDDLDNHVYTEPFRFKAERNYLNFLSGLVYLDSGFALDSSPPWYLDLDLTRIKTQHLGIEYYPDSLITQNSTEYTMIKDYLYYLQFGVEDLRKATEIPNVGVQISCLCDSSHFYDSAYGSFNDYSVDDTKLICSSTDLLTTQGLEDITTIKIGTGTESLVSKYDRGSYPTDLHSAVKTSVLTDDEKYDFTDWMMFQTFISTGVGNSWDITEAGLYDDSGNLVAYATFPPVELKMPSHYIGIQFFIKKTTF